MTNYSQLYIDGSWYSPEGDDSIEVINPATEGVIGRIPAAVAEDVDRAVAAAKAALPGWAATGPQVRAGYLREIHQELVARAPELADLISSEMGMPIKMSQRIQVGQPVVILNSYVELLETFPFSEKIGNSLVIKEPVGVVGAITPWNYPLYQLMIKLAAALAAGCTLVVKPSELAPLNAFVLADIIDSCGLPGGVFNLVSGYGVPTGEALAAHPDVAMISFTGSTRVGQQVARLGSATVKRVALELGGKSASLILDDAELETAIKATLNRCFLNSGQSCNALSRMLVPEALYARATEIAVALGKDFVPGSPQDIKTKLGPLVSAQQRDRVQEFIREGLAEGAELLLGGIEQPEWLPLGYYVQPTIFGRVTRTMTIAQEEIFGPVLSIMPYRDDHDAIRIANDSRYGLAGAVWSASQERAERMARKLQTGQVDINGGRFNPLAPFGGYKQSGLGRELGRYGLEEYLQLKSLQY